MWFSEEDYIGGEGLELDPDSGWSGVFKDRGGRKEIHSRANSENIDTGTCTQVTHLFTIEPSSVTG